MIITIEKAIRKSKSDIFDLFEDLTKVVFVHEYQLKNAMLSKIVEIDTEYIIIDNLIDYAFCYNFFRGKKTIRLNKHIDQLIEIPMPHIILIKQTY
jgi:hypothetical protein